jgi:hypothetical protein
MDSSVTGSQDQEEGSRYDGGMMEGARQGAAMTLHIELTQDQEALLTSRARQEGLAPAEFAHRLLTEQLRELPARNGENPEHRPPTPELAARVRSIRGKYAHVGATTEDLHRERQADKKREES